MTCILDATTPYWAVKRNRICLGTSRQQEIPLRIQGKPYLVIGTLAEKGSSGLFSGDRGAWVTLNYARANFSGGSPNYTLSINAPSAETLDAVQGQVWR